MGKREEKRIARAQEVEAYSNLILDQATVSLAEYPPEIRKNFLIRLAIDLGRIWACVRTGQPLPQRKGWVSGRYILNGRGADSYTDIVNTTTLNAFYELSDEDPMIILDALYYIVTDDRENNWHEWISTFTTLFKLDQDRSK